MNFELLLVLDKHQFGHSKTDSEMWKTISAEQLILVSAESVALNSHSSFFLI